MAIAFAMWQWSEAWELAHKSLTRLAHNYEVAPPLCANQTCTKQKKDNLSIILLGGAWTRTALAVEPIPYKNSADRRSSNKSLSYRLNPTFREQCPTHSQEDLQRREEVAIAFAMWQGSEAWELAHKSLTRLAHNYKVAPPPCANPTDTKQKKDNLSIILLGGA